MEKLKIQLNYGSQAGLIAFALFLLYYYLNYNPFGNIRFFSVWVPVLFLYKTIKKLRTENNQSISFGSAFQNGIFFTFIYASFSGVLIYLFGLIVPNHLVETQINDLNNNLAELDKISSMFSKDTYNMMIESVETAIENTNIKTLAWSEFQFKLMGGLFLSLLMALFMKKKPSPFEQINNAE